jgi:ABC-type nickel/cobalt efflux system permease component RcnA
LYPWLETASGVLLVILGLSLFGGRMRRLRHRAPSHDHDHPHDHHDHEHVHDHPYDHDHDHTHDHQHSSERRFLVGFRTRHSHLPPGTDGSPVTWRSLLALGISGGLLPCPSALVVMLGAIALNRIAFGLLLIIVFSLGLAGTLTAIGIMMVRAKSLLQRATVNGKLFGRIPIDRRVIQALPAISALFIVLAGLGIMFAALAQAGVIKI